MRATRKKKQPAAKKGQRGRPVGAVRPRAIYRILAVAVGPGREILDVTGAGRPNDLRDIIQGLADTLNQNYRGYYFIDYVDGKPLELEDRIKAYLTPPPLLAVQPAPPPREPDLIVPIASSATAASQVVFGAEATDTPIIFAVVSDPLGEGFLDDLKTPGGNTTGVSPNLRKSIPECFDCFMEAVRDIPGNSGTVYAMHRENFPPAKGSLPKLRKQAKKWQVTFQPFVVDGLDPISCINTRMQHVPGWQMGDPPDVGLLIVPDDLVVSRWQDVITAATTKGIPTFFQVVEFVDPNFGPNGHPCPIGAYGIPGKTIGTAVADYVVKILWQQGFSPSNMRVVDASGGEELWLNQTVATRDFNLTFTNKVLKKATKKF